MSNPHDFYYFFLIVNLIDHTLFPDPDSPIILGSRDLPTAWGVRVFSKGLELRDDPMENLRPEFFQIPFRPTLQKDFIHRVNTPSETDQGA